MRIKNILSSITFLLCISFLILFGSKFGLVNSATQTTQTMDQRRDVHSFARPDEAIIRHLKLDLDLDFEKKQITGKAALHIDNIKGVKQLYLDARDLNIKRVTARETEKDRDTTFSLGPKVQYLGQALIVDILPETKLVTVYYSTSPSAAALQWLNPGQTADGKSPFLLTQSQAALARSWIPCQDTPGVRMTYQAKVKTPPGLMAVMSAENQTKKKPDGIYEFSMYRRIPSYLMALAVGDIEFRPLGRRSGVYAEPSVVEKAAWEFADTEKMISAAEKLYGPYRWGRYDIIILPPSFPYGGMENPRLTFASPTVLAGDRSLVALVAHELAHSWSGNLVTNATWNDFWLNEGFTTYFEHRIMEQVYGKDYDDMLTILNYQDLQKEVALLGPDSPDTCLRLTLDGRNPDDSATQIPYLKGYFFLRSIEQAVGRAKWDSFLRSYFGKYAFQSVATEDFLSYLRENLFKGNQDIEKQLMIETWVYKPGMPPNITLPRSDAFEKVEEQLKAWNSGKPAKDLVTTNWNTRQWLHFIRNLPSPLTKEQMMELDQAFHFSETGNAEILQTWLLTVISNKYEPAYAVLEKFLMQIGRRKYVKPLYMELAKTPEGTEMAKRIYKQARPMYHPVTSESVDKILR